jgi:[acyl-carrier-protein] S-malonyltransferase
MDAASDGMMAALLGCDREQLEQILQETPDAVLANDNNAGQVVISGTPTAVEVVMASVKSKRAVKLNVSGAFHSPLMADAAKEFQLALDQVPFQTANIAVLSNVDPTPTTDPAILKDRLSRQMTGTVRWREISLALPDLGVERAIEVGPGKVLGGIMKRTCPDINLEAVGNLTDLAAVPA